MNPAFLFFYDWSGAFVYQPSVTFSRDPFRFAVDYSILDAGRLPALERCSSCGALCGEVGEDAMPVSVSTPCGST